MIRIMIELSSPRVEGGVAEVAGAIAPHLSQIGYIHRLEVEEGDA